MCAVLSCVRFIFGQITVDTRTHVMTKSEGIYFGLQRHKILIRHVITTETDVRKFDKVDVNLCYVPGDFSHKTYKQLFLI